MEASALTHAQKRGLFSRPTPLLRLQGDDKLVAMTRRGNPAAFEVLVQRYQPRLLGFCRQMLRSTEDAEDVLQEVFVAAYNAMLADEREIAVRPWLYRIARNRCLNHLRRPVPDGQDTMDMLPMENGASVHDRVQNREEFRQLLSDVDKLPETQRTALLLREMDAMSYEEIATSMETTVPGVKSLLVRARIALAESSQARQLTCGEVKLELAEAAEGLGKASGPGAPPRPRLRGLQRLPRSAALRQQGAGGDPPGPGARPAQGGDPGQARHRRRWRRRWRWRRRRGGAGGAAAGAGGAAAAAGGGTAAAGGAVGGAAAGGAAAAEAPGIGAVGGGVGAAIGTKVGVGMVSAVLLTAGAVEVKQNVDKHPQAQVAQSAQNADPRAGLRRRRQRPSAPDPVTPPATPSRRSIRQSSRPRPRSPPTPVTATDPTAPDPAAITTGGVVIQAQQGKRTQRSQIAVPQPADGQSTPAPAAPTTRGPATRQPPIRAGGGTGAPTTTPAGYSAAWPSPP